MEEPNRGKMMKTKLAALAGTLALTLLMTLMMTTVWGAKPTGEVLPTERGAVPPDADGDGFPDEDGVLPVCSDGSAPITGQFTGLESDEVRTVEYPVLNEELNIVVMVEVTITVASGGRDNSIDFNIGSGTLSAILVKAGAATFLYDYATVANPLHDPEDPESEPYLNQVSWDNGLNNRDGGEQEVSNLSFCLIAGEPFTSTILECTSDDGCDPSGRQVNNFDPTLAGQGFDNETVTQEPLTAVFQDTTCGLDPLNPVNVINPYIARDCRVDEFGNLREVDEFGRVLDENNNVVDCPVESDGRLDLTQLFDFSKWHQVDPGSGIPCDPGKICRGVWAHASVVGAPCIAGLKGTNSAEFADFFDAQVPLDDWTFLVTQDDEDWGVRDDITELEPGPVSEIDGRLDLSWIEQAVLQVDDLGIRSFPENNAGAFTLDVVADNSKSLKSGKGTVYLFLMREACVNAPARPVDWPDPSSDGVLYLQAIEDCKVQLALEYLNNMETVMENSDTPDLLTDAMIEPINFYRTPLNKIRNMFDNRNYKKAISDGEQFCERVTGTEWRVFDVNDPGSLSMRCSNIVHRAEELLIAEGIKKAWIRAGF
jgi:hypothetical protein